MKIQKFDRWLPNHVWGSVTCIVMLVFSGITEVSFAQGNVGNSEAIAEIVVTATKREQSLQDVALSVSVLSGEDLQRMRLMGLKDAQRFIPSLNLTQFGFAERNGPNITVRGVNNTRLTRSTDNIAALTTAFFIDEIAVTPVEVRFADVARVEVLNGPQGTLWGAASMGGTVKTVLNKAELNEFSGRVGVDGATTDGGDGSARFDLMVNVPVIEDTFALRLTAYDHHEGGFIDVRDPGLSGDRVRGDYDLPGADQGAVLEAGSQNVHKDVNATDYSGARLAATIVPSDSVELEATLLYQKKSADDATFVHRNLSRDYYRESFLPDPRDEEFKLAGLVARFQIGEAELVSVSGYTERELTWSQDVTQLVSSIYGATPTGGIPARSAVGFRRGETAFSQELRLQSTADNGRLDWVVGGYYYDESRFSDTLWIAPGFNEAVDPAFGIPNSQDLVAATDSGGDYSNTSFFGDVTFRILDNLAISAGARYYDQELDEFRTDYGPIQGVAEGEANVRPATFSQSDGWTPRASISFDLSEASMIYATVSEGFRLGGDNNNPVLETNQACIDAASSIGLGGNLDQFDSDSLVNYELGTKIGWQDNRYSMNVAAYHIDWDDLQQNVLLTLFDPLCPTSVTANIGSATIDGAEISFTGYPTDSLHLGIGASYTDAKFDEPPEGTSTFREGQAIPQVPEWQFNITAQYNFPVMEYDGFVRAGWSFVDEFTTNGYDPENPNPFLEIDSSSVLNLRAGVSIGSWFGSLYFENVTNEVVYTGAQVQAGEGFNNQAFVARPRTIGIGIEKNF